MLIKPLQVALSIGFALVLGACSTPHLNIKVNASNTLNTDESGTSYAVLIRVYQLRDLSQFEKAAYPDLWKADTEILANSLVSVHEFTVEPSIDQSVSIKREEGAKYSGVVAFFRSQEGEWKVSRKVNHGFIPASTEMILRVADEHIDLKYR